MRSKSTTGQDVSPTEARAKRSVEMKRAVRASMTKHGSSERQIAAMLGIEESLLHRRLDVGTTHQLQLGDVAGLPPSVQLDVIRHLARELGHDLVELPELLNAAGGLGAASKLLREASEAASALLDALADGRLTRAEAIDLDRELAEVTIVAESIRRWCHEAIVTGVVSTVGGLQ